MEAITRHLLRGPRHCGALGVTGAQAQTYPAKPVSLVVGFAPGGSADSLARLLAQKLGSSLGQPVIVDNKPGAGATIATAAVAASKPDGYTLLMVTSGHAGSAALYPKLSYDTLKSFEPVAKVGASPVVIVAPAAAPYKQLKDVIAGPQDPRQAQLRGRRRRRDDHEPGSRVPEERSEDRHGHGAVQGLWPGADGAAVRRGRPGLRHSVERIAAHQGGQAASAGGDQEDALERAAGCADGRGARQAGFEVTGWFGVLAPAGTPAAVIARLNKEINAVLSDPDVKERLAWLGVEPGAALPTSAS